MRIPTFDQSHLDNIRSEVIKIAKDKSFTLPSADIHLVGVSSGVDSTAVALVMAALYPDETIHYVFTDTGVEVEGTYEQLEKLERLIGQPIHRIKGKKDLFEIIQSQGNYLPSQRQRYCTRMTKIMPLQAYFVQLRHKHGADLSIASYVGIRADEPTRQGGQFSDGIASYFPLQELGFDRSEVYRLVNRYVGIPLYYMDKSRSGCEICIFSRRSEVIARIQRDSRLAVQASKMEALTETDRNLLLTLPPSVSELTGLPGNYLCFAKPSFIFPEASAEDALRWEKKRSTVTNNANHDLFRDRQHKTFWVAIQEL